MPATTERIALGMYCICLNGTITADDLFAGRDGVEALATVDGIGRFVLMVDGTVMQQPLFDVPVYRHVITKRMMAILALNVSYSGMVIGNIVRQLVSIPVHFYDDRQQWMAEAARCYAACNQFHLNMQ
ncbi:MAG TPA: hypothetical protein PLQ56_20815 [Aggregatilineales bacterium]|nr:hypothetical protein [Aggregatilineales bacterium]